MDMPPHVSSPSPVNVLLVDDSRTFRLMVARDLLKRGFTLLNETVYGRDHLKIYITADYDSSAVLILNESERHVDFSALFLDWHLAANDRAQRRDGVQLALLACDERHQPLKPVLYCISAENAEMKEAILNSADFGVMEDKVILVDFIHVVDKMIEAGGQG